MAKLILLLASSTKGTRKSYGQYQSQRVADEEEEEEEEVKVGGGGGYANVDCAFCF